jgi:hypothetical protein
MMFKDQHDNLIEEMEEILQDYSLQEILEDNDLTEAEALYHLWRTGYIVLPETISTTIIPLD